MSLSDSEQRSELRSGPRLGLIWAQTPAGVIGSGGTIPWHVPEDFAHFKRTTLGSAVIMGRRTWDSLPDRARPLPDRRNIVVTRNAEWRADGAERAGSLAAALQLAGEERVWVIGGGELYREAIGAAEVLVVTEIDLDVPGDTFAPATAGFSGTVGEWQTSRTGIRYRFATLTHG